MTRRKPLLLLAMLLATSVTGLAIAANPTPSKSVSPRMDANGDGLVDRQEAAAHPYLVQRFDELDKNKDGKLSRDEMPRRHARGGDGRHGRHAHHRGHQGDGFMRRMDANGDGRISTAEHQAFFERMDVNKDGFIDQADRQARAEQRRAEWFAKVDTDKDGKLSPAELEAARKDGHRGHHGPRGPMPPQAPAAK